MGKVLL